MGTRSIFLQEPLPVCISTRDKRCPEPVIDIIIADIADNVRAPIDALLEICEGLFNPSRRQRRRPVRVSKKSKRAFLKRSSGDPLADDSPRPIEHGLFGGVEYDVLVGHNPATQEGQTGPHPDTHFQAGSEADATVFLGHFHRGWLGSPFHPSQHNDSIFVTPPGLFRERSSLRASASWHFINTELFSVKKIAQNV